MSTFYTHQTKNQWKTFFLILTFVAMVTGVGWFLSYQYGDPNILYIAIAVSLGMNLWAYWFSHKTVIRMTRAQEADINEYRELHNLVENLSITAGLPKPKVYIIEDRALNAFATGRNKHNAVVAVTTGLIQKLDRNELEGVVAHELAHIGNNDMLISTMAVVLVSTLTIIADMFMWGNSSRSENNGGPAAIIGLLVIVIIMPLVGTLLRLAISRKREYLADATAARLTRYPEGLASALRTISQGSILKSSPKSAAHLFIANPLRGKGATNVFQKIFSTHPPVEKRIQALMEMDGV